MMLFSQFYNAVSEWSKRHRALAVSEAFLYRWGALVVAAVAFIYYAQYYRSGLNLGGEGGTVAVVAMRLMDGWLPIKETFLGYNLMWFYPVVWLFEVFGPSYIALRVFFFAICTLTGVMAFFIVRRATGSGWYAVLAALLPVFIPGMLFRNYMAFLAMLNMLTFLQGFVFTQRKTWQQAAWMLASGLSLGLTYLVRVDLGIFFSVIVLGLVVLYPFARGGGFLRNAGFAALALALVAAGVLVTHTPFYLDAQKRGYAREFAGQYTGWAGLIRTLLADKLGFDPFAPPAGSQPVYTPSRVQLIGLYLASRDAGKPTKAQDLGQDNYLQKKTVDAMAEAKTWSERLFPVVTYLPILVAVVVVLPSGLALLVGIFRRDIALREQAQVLLITMGAALTLFPQFFFFRPDTPHLSELMAPFFVSLACAAWCGALLMRRGLPGLVLGSGIVLLCAANALLYFLHAFPKESAGTIAAREKRKSEMRAQNGVRVFLKKDEREQIQKLADLIQAHTKPGDYVACYPYQPTINFMTDRPAYEYNLYIDNAHNVSRFHEETMAKIAKFRPAAIVIDNRAVNQTEDSRFQNWAPATYEWVKANYKHAGTFRRQELYFRPDLAPADGPK
jgi:hypothetical protein